MLDPATLTISIGALGIAVVAAWYSAKAYLLKSGLKLRGMYSTASSVFADDKYVGSVIIENQKDRAVAIYRIFLELSHGYYLLLDDFEHEPFILGAFEVLRRDYDPIDHYSIGMSRIKIDELLEHKSVRRRLVLSTSDGRYVIKKYIPRWDPISVFFRNHNTAVIRPIRSTFEGKSYGSGTKFIVRLKTADGRNEIVPLYDGAHRVQIFKGFTLAKESMASRDALEEFLLDQALAGNLRCGDLDVFDLGQWRREAYGTYGDNLAHATAQGWFEYEIFGRLSTWWSNRRTRKKNRDLRTRQAARARALQEGRRTEERRNESPAESTPDRE
jgi:hypothetical protein